MSEKIQQLQDVLKLVNGGLTRSEFLDNFKIIIDFVKQLKNNTQISLDSVDSKFSQATSEVKDKCNLAMMDMKEKAMSFCDKETVRLEDIVNQRLSDLKDGKDGVDGKDADEEKVAKNASKIALNALQEDISAILNKELPQEGENIRDALEILKGDERLDKSAIKGLEEELQRISAIKGTTIMGGGTRVDNSIDNEVPTGTIDGANTDFVLNWTPLNGSLKVFRGGARQQITGDYTLSDKTITFLLPPQIGEIIICDYKRI